MEAKQRLHSSEPIENRWLTIDEVRLVSDLRIMHSKVTELFQVVNALKQRHPEEDIRKYADHVALEKDIHEVDTIYLWFLGLKEGR
jgi:hypothetical protein